MERDRLIQSYLQNILTSEQKEDFAQLMASDPSFKEEVKILEDLQVVDHNDQLSDYKAIFQKQEAKIARRRFQSLVAIICACLIAGVLIFYLLQKRQQENYLFAKYFQTPQNSYYPILRDTDDSSLPIYRAFLAYEQRDFKAAKEELENLENYSESPELQFYNAISLLELEDFDEALTILDNIMTNDEELTQDISWYSALIYLRRNEVDKAKAILQGISLSPSRKQILDEL